MTERKTIMNEEDKIRQIVMQDTAEVMRCIVVKHVVRGDNCEYLNTSVYTMAGELLASRPTPISQMPLAPRNKQAQMVKNERGNGE